MSRIGLVRPRPVGECARLLPRQAKGMRMRYGPTPIERTLQQRQALQPSSSEPSLGSTSVWHSLSLPRISTTISAGWDTSQAWLDILNGGRRVVIPFNKLSDNVNDTDSFVQWYRESQEQKKSLAAAVGSTLRQEPSRRSWAERREEMLLRYRTAGKSAGLAAHCKAKAELFDHLDQRMVAQGMQALVEAMRFKAGSLEDATSLLDLHGNGELSVMELAGGLTLLGLDPALLSAADEFFVFRHLDPEATGILKLQAFMRAAPPRSFGKRVAAISSAAADCTEEPKSELRLAQAKWLTVAKWMATAARRSAALAEERFRRGWRVGTGSPGGAGSAAEWEATPAAQHAVDAIGALAEDSIGHVTSSVAAKRKRFQAPPEQVLLESGAAMREQDQDLKVVFSKATSAWLSEGSTERILRRPDLTTFFEDLHLVEPWRHLRATVQVLDKRYDEAIRVQHDCTQLDHGLLFWSFKALLNNIMGDLRLGWSGLVEATLTLQE